jgi:hypothetical protein
MTIQSVVLDCGFLQSGGMCLKFFPMQKSLQTNTAEFAMTQNGPEHVLEVASA